MSATLPLPYKCLKTQLAPICDQRKEATCPIFAGKYLKTHYTRQLLKIHIARQLTEAHIARQLQKALY
jgi:hypothetical protein